MAADGKPVPVQVKRPTTSLRLVDLPANPGSMIVTQPLSSAPPPIPTPKAKSAPIAPPTLKTPPMRVDPVFGFAVPTSMEGIDEKLLNPRETWKDPKAYDAMAAKLAQMFHDNFAKFATYVDADVLKASPLIDSAVAAE